MKTRLIVVVLCAFLKVEGQTSTFKYIDSLIQFGQYKLALTELKKTPLSFKSTKKTALIYEATDNIKKAIVYYKKSLQLKDDYAVKVKLGIVYKKNQNLSKAIAIFEEIAKNDPKNTYVKYQLGKLYLQTKKSEKAEKIFKYLIAKDSKNANYSYLLGMTYSQLKKRNFKINNYLNAYRKDSTHFKAIEKLARNFTKLKFRDSALIFIDKGLTLNPNHINLNKLKINDLYRRKKYRQAITLLHHIDSVKKNEAYTQKMLGKSYLNINNYKKAEEYLNKAKKIEKNNYKIYPQLGTVYLKQKQIEKAKMQFLLATIVGKKPRDEEYYQLALINYNSKKTKSALKHFKKAFNENQKNSTALFWLAKVSDDYYKDKKISYNLYQKYLELFKEKDKKTDLFVKSRILEIKKEFFLQGISLE